MLLLTRRRASGLTLPSSVTHLVRPSAMTFSGGNLTGVTDEVAGSSSYFGVTGTLPGNTSSGYQMAESNSGAYVTLTSLVAGANFALRLKRNATADTQTVLLGGISDTRFCGACEDGSSSTATEQNVLVTSYRVDGTTYTASGGTTRNALWDAALGDTTERVVLFRSLTENAGPPAVFRLGWYQLSAWVFEGTIAGWSRFTDWAEADDVAAFLLSTDPV